MAEPKVSQINPEIINEFWTKDTAGQSLAGSCVLTVGCNYELHQQLNQHGFITVKWDSVSSVSSSNFDVVLIDDSKEGNFQLCSLIRQSTNELELPVIVLSANPNKPKYVQVNEVVKLPLDPEILVQLVGKWIRLKKTYHFASQESRFLQSQFKPHFLFNAMNVIASLTFTDPDKARDLIVDLTEFLRSRFDYSSEEKNSLFQEIELVKSYLSIEQTRFAGKFVVNFEIDDIPDITMPKLVLQPLVENAFRHGIFHIQQGGVITVKINIEDAAIKFLIEDNGVGVNQGDIQSFLWDKTNLDKGLCNINYRLIKFYGAGLVITTGKQKGTSVSFKIPLER